jgi:3-phytase
VGGDDLFRTFDGSLQTLCPRGEVRDLQPQEREWSKGSTKEAEELIMATFVKRSVVLLLIMAAPAPAPAERAKNIILFLGDAAGIPTLNAASIYGYNKPRSLFLQSMPHIALSETSTASAWVTDSAAGMTAIVTGRKTHNGVISESASAVRGSGSFAPVNGVAPVTPKVTCLSPDAEDQDDMCVWLHPVDRSQSTIVVSDKKAGKIFVYDLQGKTLQSVPARDPGNIDVRYNFCLGGQLVDIVALTEQADATLFVYKVNAQTRQLERVDAGDIRTATNYGGTLYHSPKTRRFYFVTTSKQGAIEQYELMDNGTGKVTGKKVRGWKLDTANEGAVGDDERGKLYIAEEQRGVWEVGGEPDDPTPGKRIINVGENGLVGDAEGIAIYYLTGDDGYLIVSNQDGSNFKVYERCAPHRFVGTFAVAGARRTDGLDICNANLGPLFPKGLFVCHSSLTNGKSPVLLTPWEEVANGASAKLKVDTSRCIRR